MTLIDFLDTAKIYAGAEFERLCNNNKHVDACVFQSIRDSIKQSMQLLLSYVEVTGKEGVKKNEDVQTLS